VKPRSGAGEADSAREVVHFAGPVGSPPGAVPPRPPIPLVDVEELVPVASRELERELVLREPDLFGLTGMFGAVFLDVDGAHERRRLSAARLSNDRARSGVSEVKSFSSPAPSTTRTHGRRGPIASARSCATRSTGDEKRRRLRTARL
jgi:hypothetical protein